MLQDEVVDTGDYVMVHVGYAIQKMMPVEARTSWELYDQMMSAE
jgi:hydrogenase expression/formation protein HypC